MQKKILFQLNLAWISVNTITAKRDKTKKKKKRLKKIIITDLIGLLAMVLYREKWFGEKYALKN